MTSLTPRLIQGLNTHSKQSISNTKRAVSSLFLTNLVFGLMLFIYVVALSFFAPYWLDEQVIHLQNDGGILHPTLMCLRDNATHR